jgi:hypothetical protein
MKIDKIIYLFTAVLLASCTADEDNENAPQQEQLQISTSIEDFVGETRTRTNIEGDKFDDGDKIKIKIICPKSDAIELGESTYGASFDSFYLLKWNINKWTTLTSDDHYDINGDYSDSASPDIFSRYLAQPTLYVFTAQTWSEEQIFIVNDDNKRIEQYSNVFHADQSDAADYMASDLMWAQTIMQTGTYNIHLSFKHVMAAIKVTVVDKSGNKISDNAVLTLEGMPDIDQSEVIVGDYYAGASQANVENFGYKSKHSCTADKNGNVIGVAQYSKDGATTVGINTINQKATYTAYKDGNTFRLIVPPCELNSKAKLLLRDGSKRYSMELERTSFVEGNIYNITMNLNDETI